MIKRIRDFFCNVDPVGLTITIMVGGITLAEMISLGLLWFVGVLLIGIILLGLILGIGWCLYKTIVYAQSFCK